MGRFPTVQISLPDWMDDSVPHGGVVLTSADARMEFVIRLSRRNVEEGTGGPFAAAIFLCDSGVLVAPGVNRVVPAMCSVAHAEMVAIMVAQQMAKTFDLGSEGRSACELVTSTEPCAMCLGAIPWCGVRRVVCGARREDAEGQGFDEGERSGNWVTGLTRRGIEVLRDVRREEAAEVLRAYNQAGGLTYNGRMGGG